MKNKTKITSLLLIFAVMLGMFGPALKTQVSSSDEHWTLTFDSNHNPQAPSPENHIQIRTVLKGGNGMQLIPANLPVAHNRPSWEFQGWYVNVKVIDPRVNLPWNRSLVIPRDITLYAHWVQVDVCLSCSRIPCECSTITTATTTTASTTTTAPSTTTAPITTTAPGVCRRCDTEPCKCECTHEKCRNCALCFAPGCNESGFSKCDCHALGDITGDGKIGTDDALEVLKSIVKLPSKAQPDNPKGWDAAFIVTPKTAFGPTTSDALEILKYIVKLPGVIVANSPNPRK